MCSRKNDPSHRLNWMGFYRKCIVLRGTSYPPINKTKKVRASVATPNVFSISTSNGDNNTRTPGWETFASYTESAQIRDFKGIDFPIHRPKNVITTT